MVKTEDRKFARGHSPASHSDYEQRGKAISKTVRKKYAAGYVNPFSGKKHKHATKKRMSAYAQNRPAGHRKHLAVAIKRRSQNPVWISAQLRNAAKGSKVHADLTRGIPRTIAVCTKMSRTRRARIKAGLIKPWNKGLFGIQVAWNKGLTRDTDSRVAAYANALSDAYADGSRKVISRNDWLVWYQGPKGKMVMRCKPELAFALWLDAHNEPWEYEQHRFKVVVNGFRTTYTPDFYLPQRRVFIEVKGRLESHEILKYFAFQEQHPDKEWYLLMQNPGLHQLGAMRMLKGIEIVKVHPKKD